MNKISKKFHNLYNSAYWQLSIIILIAFMLRIYRLGYHDLWYDEIITLTKIPHLNFLRVWNPPLYFALLAGWVKIFGFSEISLRFPSLLFSLACIPIIFLLGKEIFNKSAGLYASLIIVLSPFQLWYAQEARAYSTMLFLGLLSSYFQALFINREQHKYLFGYTISTILGLYTHPYYVLFFIAQLICLFIYCARNWSKKILVTILLIGLSFIPLIQKYSIRLAQVISGYWIPSPDWNSLLITVENLLLGYNSRVSAYLISDILTLILFISAIWFVRQRKDSRRGFIFCLILFVVPIILAFLFSKLFVPIYFDRGLIVCSPYYYLILGLGISAFRKKVAKSSAIISIFLLLVIGVNGFVKNWLPSDFFHHVGAPPKKPIKPIVEFINKNSGSDDVIAFTNDSIMLPFIWYAHGKDVFYADRRGDDINHFLERYRFLFGPGSTTPSYKRLRKENKFNVVFYKIKELEFERLWVLACDWSRDGSLDENSLLIREWLNKNFNLELEKEFDGVWVYRYAK